MKTLNLQDTYSVTDWKEAKGTDYVWTKSSEYHGSLRRIKSVTILSEGKLKSFRVLKVKGKKLITEDTPYEVS